MKGPRASFGTITARAGCRQLHREQLSDLVNHITTVAKHFAGKVFAWDDQRDLTRRVGSNIPSADKPGIGLNGKEQPMSNKPLVTCSGSKALSTMTTMLGNERKSDA